FASSPKNFFAVDCVITIECNCLKAVARLPCTNGNVNMLNKELSAYLPDAYIDLSPMLNNDFISSSDTRQVFITPGISLFISAYMGLGVDQFVKVLPAYVAFSRIACRFFLFTLLLSQFNSSSAHKKIKPAHAMPIAKPKML